MNNYSKFIHQYSNELLMYYKILHTLKHSLGLPTPIVDTDSLTIDTTPLLLIINLYNKDTAKRRKRAETIEEFLRKNNIKYKIISGSSLLKCPPCQNAD